MMNLKNSKKIKGISKYAAQDIFEKINDLPHITIMEAIAGTVVSSALISASCIKAYVNANELSTDDINNLLKEFGQDLKDLVFGSR